MLYELFAVYFWLWASKAPACLMVLKCIPRAMRGRLSHSGRQLRRSPVDAMSVYQDSEPA